MKPCAPRLSTRITLAGLLLVVAGGTLWINNENQRLHEIYLSERESNLEVALHVEKVRLVKTVETLRQDVVFLSNTPPISGIVRAAANRGLDPRDKNSRATWEARLQEIFAAFLRGHPDYSHARFIGVADGGRELVRVNRRDGRVEVTPRDLLQAKGDRDFFKAGLTLSKGQVYLSEFDLEQEWGKVVEPHHPTLRAVTPVFDAYGNRFGMLVLNIDTPPLFAAAVAALPSGVQGYVADQHGRYLLHPDAGHAFTFEVGGQEKITREFSLLNAVYGAQAQSYLPMQATNNRAGGYLAAERVDLDAGEAPRFLLLAYYLPEQVVSAQTYAISTAVIVKTIIVVILLGLVFMLVLRRVFAPLNSITEIAGEIAAGNHQLRLREMGGGEIGKLTVALNVMLDKLSVHDLLAHENAFRKELIESLPGIFYMIDMQGHFLMWNRNLEKVLGMDAGEVAGLMALDIFEGDDKRLIESKIGEAFQHGEAATEAELRTKNGVRIPYHFTGRRVQRDGQPMLIGMGLDITEQRESVRVKGSVLQRYKQVIDTAMDGFWMTDERGILEEVNAAYVWMSGYPMQELVGMHISQLEAGERPEEVEARIGKVMAQGSDRFESQHRRKDGSVFEVEVSTTYLPECRKFFVFSHDITLRRQAEQALRVAAAAFETHDAILITDAQSNIIRVNRAFTEITGYGAEEVLGKNPRIMNSGRQDRAFYSRMWQQLLHGGSWSGEIWDKRKNGEIYPKWLSITAVKNERHEITQYVAIFSDITERKRIEEEIRTLAFYDTLTQLPNRRLFIERLRAALSASARRRDYGAVLFLDMDRFKLLNDTLGHECGDLMLIEVAQRIKACVREMDTVARLGGDEFVVLIESVSQDGQDASRKVGTVAEKIREALAHPYRIKEHEHHSSPSIGIALYRDNEESVDALLHHADLAMYQAKNSGRNAVCFFDPVMQDKAERHDALESDLHLAVERGELRLYYQVQVDNAQRPVGAEALLRWEHPQRGLVMPDQFIPVAEESALIIVIGRWVLEEACAQLGRWNDNARMRTLTLSVNISARQFAQPDFVAQVVAVIERHRIDPARLKLELTGSVVSADLAGTVEKMRALRGIGVNLSVDDFGMVYSSLYYLKQLSTEQLKIHRDVVKGVTGAGNDVKLVQAIVDLAKNMELDVFAEGVETEEQFALLKLLDCKAYQGYLFSKPVPLDELQAMMDKLP